MAIEFETAFKIYPLWNSIANNTDRALGDFPENIRDEVRLGICSLVDSIEIDVHGKVNFLLSCYEW